MKKLLPFLFITCLFFMAFQCEDDNVTTQESEQNALIASKKAIEDLAATSVCNDTYECKFIALGSKPCGGPWGYVVYSTSIDTEKLKKMVETHNKNEADYNKKWGAASDCMFVTPPTSVNCENNNCIAIY
ncbi:hypothetical protein ACGK9U_02585 [Mariniflexile sp. HNIBRBA6329]|uniref:hypothetical protein n=1 Tax=Mariniflexile sp. HNIBRBA6329 TaxID=3373088 RepID=UPI00374630DD